MHRPVGKGDLRGFARTPILASKRFYMHRSTVHFNFEVAPLASMLFRITAVKTRWVTIQFQCSNNFLRERLHRLSMPAKNQKSKNQKIKWCKCIKDTLCCIKLLSGVHYAVCSSAVTTFTESVYSLSMSAKTVPSNASLDLCHPALKYWRTQREI